MSDVAHIGALRASRRSASRRTPRKILEDDILEPPKLSVAIATPARSVVLSGSDLRDLALAALEHDEALMDEAARHNFAVASRLVRAGKPLPDCLKFAAWMRASWLGQDGAPSKP